jgi:hypothetical protein
MRNLANQVLDGEEILVSDKGANTWEALGPALELRNCTVIFRIPSRGLGLVDTRFVNCRIVAKRALSGIHWPNVALENCTFAGTFNDCSFGHVPHVFAKMGKLVGGDFSQAVLNGVTFRGTDASQIVFPSWPCFTLLDPTGSHALDRMATRHKWRFYAEALTDSPADATAVTALASYIVKHYGGTEEELREVLTGVPNVIF